MFLVKKILPLLALTPSLAFATANYPDWYVGLGYSQSTKNELDKTDSKIMSTGLNLSKSNLLQNTNTDLVGKQNISVDDISSYNILVGKQIVGGFSIEAQYGYTPKSDFYATSYTTDDHPHFNYVFGKYEAHNYALYGSYRKTLSESFYIKGRIGVGYYDAKAEYKHSTQAIASTSENQVGEVEATYHTSQNKLDLNTKDDKVDIAGGLGLGLRITNNSNFEVTYENSPLMRSVQGMLVFRF